jgi:hypothetical protein
MRSAIGSVNAGVDQVMRSRGNCRRDLVFWIEYEVRPGPGSPALRSFDLGSLQKAKWQGRFSLGKY